MNTLYLLDFANATVNVYLLPDNFTTTEDIEGYISEELKLNVDECQYMFGKNIRFTNHI